MQADPTARGADTLSPDGSIELPDELRDLVQDEAGLLASMAGDALKVATASDAVRQEIPRVALAARMFRAAETGRIERDDCEAIGERIRDLYSYLVAEPAELATRRHTETLMTLLGER